ncbi:hypothetical protein EVAR_63990_1 [Eumeta japonica]|uniref:Uncharacterized protein n=1 Tax=Eumeta variegata TaxID=151549 RepID=A0A4C1ZGV4_EUMVA|nr:hypothetical protein EVAR_63990_1 [Eumeta japonica]
MLCPLLRDDRSGYRRLSSQRKKNRKIEKFRGDLRAYSPGSPSSLQRSLIVVHHDLARGDAVHKRHALRYQSNSLSQ